MSIEELKLPKRIDEEKLQAFKELFPDVFADGKVNLAALKDELGEETEDDDVIEEHYGFNWPGKRAAKKLAVLPLLEPLILQKARVLMRRLRRISLLRAIIWRF